MARRTRGVRASRGPKNNIWSVVLLENVTVSTGVVEANVLESAEWQGAMTSFQHATILRVRGWLSVASLAATSATNTFTAAIYVVDEDDAALAPNNALLYTDEDVLWTAGFTATGPGNKGQNFDVDIKAMRRINSGQEMRLTMVAAANGFLVGGAIRALVRRGGN